MEVDDWQEIDGKLYCPDCYKYDEETDEYKPTLNHFLCKKCRDIAMNDLRKEETE